METAKQISPQRRRIGGIAAAVVVLVLGVIFWQTWEYWVPGPEPTPPLPLAGGPPRAFGGGMPGPEEMRRRIEDQLKSEMAVSEEEWARLWPKVERVTQLQQQLQPRNPMGRPGRTPTPAAPGAASPATSSDASDYAEKADLLREAVDDEQTTPEALAANVAAARAARKKLEAELKTAQEELRKAVTPRQEAALALHGVLD
jgi:hypothetical protein